MSKAQKVSSGAPTRSSRRDPEPEPILSSRRTSSSSAAIDGDRRSGRKRSVEDAENAQQYSSSSSSSSKRNNERDMDIEVDVDDNVEVLMNYNPKTALKVGSTNEKDLAKFSTLSVDAQAQCIKAVARYLVMKGGKKETISRSGISDVLNKIDPEYKKHLGVVLAKAYHRLNKILGFTVVTTEAILGFKAGNDKKQDEYYLTNNLRSDKLQRILSTASSQTSGGAWFGFMVIIFFNIYTAHGKRAAVEDLLVAVRKIDKRFPATLNVRKREGDESLPVPELGDDFLGLLARMKKEHYIAAHKPSDDDKGVNDPGKTVYCLGPRYFLDIGNKQLMTEYYKFMCPGHDPDKAVMKEIEEERLRELEDSTTEAA